MIVVRMFVVRRSLFLGACLIPRWSTTLLDGSLSRITTLKSKLFPYISLWPDSVRYKLSIHRDNTCSSTCPPVGLAVDVYRVLPLVYRFLLSQSTVLHIFRGDKPIFDVIFGSSGVQTGNCVELQIYSWNQRSGWCKICSPGSQRLWNTAWHAIFNGKGKSWRKLANEDGSLCCRLKRGCWRAFFSCLHMEGNIEHLRYMSALVMCNDHMIWPGCLRIRTLKIC